MTGDELKIVIKGTRDDWPGGPRTPTPRDPCLEPNQRTLWFGANLDPDGIQVWFRIALEAIGRMREPTAEARGNRVIDAFLAGLQPDHRLTRQINRFEVRVSDNGDTWIERLRC